MPDPSDNLDLPPSLANSLKSHRAQVIPIPPDLDTAILAEAHRRISRRRPRALLLRWATIGGAGAAVAAGLAVAVHLFNTTRPQSSPVASSSTFDARYDLNHDGRVDILDAFYLAQHLKSGQLSPQWDINGDGKVDQSDVDALAAAAVRVGGVQ